MRFSDRGLVGVTLFLMVLTLFVPPIDGNVIRWGLLSPFSYARSVVWLLGSLVLPGYCALKCLRIDEKVGGVSVMSLTLHVSLLLVGLMGYLFYLFSIPFNYLPILTLLIIFLLILAGRENQPRLFTFKAPDLYDFVFICSLALILSLAALIQFRQRYLISGDLWVVLKAGAQIISRQQFFLGWDQEYPFFFGFILAPISYFFGVPLLNAYVLSFPLMVINSVSFCSFLKELFGLDRKIVVVSNLIYVLSGGLGCLLNILLYGGSNNFLWISYLTQDMYHRYFFWFNIEFTYKVLALTFVYASITVFMVSRRFSGALKNVLIAISSVSLVYSFLIHMIDVLLFIPVFLFLLYQDRGHRFRNMFVFGGLAVMSFFILDSGFHFYYSGLLHRKVVSYLLPQLNLDLLLAVAATTGLFAALLLYFSRHPGEIDYDAIFIKHRWSIVVVLSLVYVSGLIFWHSARLPDALLYELNYFPWYLFVTRFGFVGAMALASLLTFEGQNWYKVLALWALFVVVLGNLFWGSRIVDYVMPVVACLSGYLLVRAQGIRYKVLLRLTSLGVDIPVDLGKWLNGLLILSLLLSFTSQLCGATHYIESGPSMSDEEADVFRWVFYNTPGDSVFLVLGDYSTWLGMITVADRDIFEADGLRSLNNTSFFDENYRILVDNGVGYVVYDEENPYGLFGDWLVSSSDVVYELDRFKVCEIK